MQLQHTMYAPRVGVQVTVNTATVARTCLNPGLGGARRARRSQEEQGGARRSEGEPGGARKSQKRPGGARTRRGEEEPVAALLTHTCCSADARHCTHCHLDCLASVGIGGWLFSTHKSLGSRVEDRCFILHRCLLSDQEPASVRLAALSASPVANTQQKWETANTKQQQRQSHLSVHHRLRKTDLKRATGGGCSAVTRLPVAFKRHPGLDSF